MHLQGLDLVLMRATAGLRVVNLNIVNVPRAPASFYASGVYSFNTYRDNRNRTEDCLHLVNVSVAVSNVRLCGFFFRVWCQGCSRRHEHTVCV